MCVLQNRNNTRDLHIQLFIILAYTHYVLLLICGHGFQGNAEFNRVTGNIQSEVNSHLSGADNNGTESSSITRSLSEANDTIFNNRDTAVDDIREVRTAHVYAILYIT